MGPEVEAAVKENSVLLNFPLASFLGYAFVQSVLSKRGDKDLSHDFRLSMSETALMSLVGHMCNEEELSSSGRQPTVGDLVKMTKAQLKSYRGIGDSKVELLEQYLAIFGLSLCDQVQKISLSDTSNQLLQAIQPKIAE